MLVVRVGARLVWVLVVGRVVCCTCLMLHTSAMVLLLMLVVLMLLLLLVLLLLVAWVVGRPTNCSDKGWVVDCRVGVAKEGRVGVVVGMLLLLLLLLVVKVMAYHRAQGRRVEEGGFFISFLSISRDVHHCCRSGCSNLRVQFKPI